MNRALPAADLQSLTRARMAAPANLTWEAAADRLVRLYELQTRQVIQPMTTPATLPGFNNVSAAYQQSVLKAADIGFVNTPLQPGRELTMADMMHMMDIVMVDSRW